MMSMYLKLLSTKINIVILLSLTLLMSGCNATKSNRTKFKNVGSQSELSLSTLNKNKQQIEQNPWSFIQDQLQISVPDNKRIKTEKEKILKNGTLFENNLVRSEPYIYYIVKQLNERNMPVELALIPLIESGYNPKATSYAKAAGLWQIVPVTAQQYGLTKNSWYDPRRDLIESTDAAITLLQNLNQQFEGDWLLTLAAYNAGEGRVKRAIASNQAKGLPTNFWALNLSNETMQYIPKLLATAEIIRNNEKYGVTLPEFNYDNALVKVELSKQISLDKVANYAGISMDQLQEYNAAYLKKVVKDPYHLFVPKSYANTLNQQLQASSHADSKIVDLLKVDPNLTIPQSSYVDSNLTNNRYVNITDKDIHFYENEHKRYNQVIHQIKSGDSLYAIAKKYKVKVSDIVKWNNIKNPDKLKLGTKLTIEIRGNNA